MISIPQLVTDIRGELGSFFTTESFNTTSLLKIINSGIRKVCLAANWRFNDYIHSIATDGVTEEYTIPKWYKIYGIKVGGTTGEYKPVDFETYFSSNDNEKYKLIGFKQEKLYTKLALTMDIIYRGMPDRVTTLSGNIDLPDDVYDILVSACVYYGYLHVKQYPRADKRVEDFNNEVNRVRALESDPFPREHIRMGSQYSLRASR